MQKAWESDLFSASSLAHAIVAPECDRHPIDTLFALRTTGGTCRCTCEHTGAQTQLSLFLAANREFNPSGAQVDDCQYHCMPAMQVPVAR